MRVVSLVENTSCHPMRTEHGLSLYIETEKHRILFDTGQGTLFAENAEKLGVDLSAVDLCFLSHGHYDHGGGLKLFSEMNRSAPVIVSENAFGHYYEQDGRYVGLERRWLDDEAFRSRLVLTRGDERLDDELEILVPRRRILEMGSAGLKVMRGGSLYPDDFLHEQYLRIEERGRRILISGCSHQGIINIIEWFGPDVLIGGFHFMTHDLDEKLREYAERLDSYDTEYYTCHCTGTRQYEYIRPLVRRLHYLAEGDEIVL